MPTHWGIPMHWGYTNALAVVRRNVALESGRRSVLAPVNLWWEPAKYVSNVRVSILSTNPDDVPSNSPSTAVGDWHQSLRTAIRSVDELLEILGLPPIGDPAGRELMGQVTRDFPTFAPREYVARMRPRDPQDPLLLQVLPSPAESKTVAGFGRDPVGDLTAAGPAGDSEGSNLDGMLKKYRGRALLITTGACAVHCRYCFRRHFPYEETPRGIEAWQPALERLAADPTMEEVILSGGDPLTLRDTWLAELVERLATIPHLKRLRVHTRLPIMIPSRVNDMLLGWLRGTRLVPVMVIHANHANELKGEDVESAIARLVDAGVPVLNQAVLLRGINDSVESLENLSRQLVALRTMPYYLHQLDRVAGAAHFEVPTSKGRELIAELRARVPGYMVPRYVVENAGATSKTILA